MNFKVEWETAELDAFLEALEAGIPDTIGKILVDVGEATFSWSQNIVPVVTSNLKKSGWRARTDVMEFQMGYSAPYAAYVEWGTSKMAPRRFLRIAWIIVRSRVKMIAKATLERMIAEAK
jgi:HK97 gp10 family phage protein